MKKPNELGIYDMSGNVWEWGSDWYGKYAYRSSEKKNPKGISGGEKRVLRGGSFTFLVGYLNTSLRFFEFPDVRKSDIGFRCVKNTSDIKKEKE